MLPVINDPSRSRSSSHSWMDKTQRSQISITKNVKHHHASLLIFLLLIVSGCSSERSSQSAQQAKEPTLIVGMRHEAALQIIRECGGQDITSNMAVVGPRGEWPLTGLFWNFKQYDSVLEIGAKDGTVIGIGYWNGADFSESKSHQVLSRKSLKSVTFEKQANTLKTQPLEEANLPFTVTIVPSSSSTDSRWIVIRENAPKEFYVVLTNTSSQPQSVFEWWNSWGYQTISFEFTTADNLRIFVSKREQDFTKNYPSTFLIPPNEHQIYPIQLNKEWEGVSEVSKLANPSVTVKAIYQVGPCPESAQYGVWAGRVESERYTVNISR